VKVVEEGRGLVSLALFSLAGLHTHYDFIFYLAVTGGVLLVLCFKPLHRHAALRGIGVLSLVGVLFAPWASYGLMHQLEHGLPPGSTHTHIYALAESIGHMYFINVGLGGDLIRIAAICGVVLAGVLMIRGVMILRKRDQHLLYLCLAFGIVVPLLVFIVAHIYPRAAHNWRYVAGSALPVFVLAAAGGMSKPRIFLVLLAALLLCLSSLTLSNALSRGREDSRSAVDFILDAVDEKDTVLLAPTMVPGGHRTSLPWDYYSGRTGREEKLDGEDLLLSLDSRKINLQGTLFFMERGHSIGKLKYLKQRFDLQETNSFGSDLRVHQFRLR
jgi:hypothetical protein